MIITGAVGVVAGRGNHGGGCGGRVNSNTKNISTSILESFYLREAPEILVCHDSVRHDVVGEELQCAIER